ncbi:MAG: VOC family protein [Rhodobacteraceae bacterium]|nr:VOC family protein [Paracoccaceae bacterium]
MFEHHFAPDLPLCPGLGQGECDLHPCERGGDGAPGAAKRIEVPDVDAYCAALNAKSYRHARPGVLAQPWGRDMAISDPFGNRSIFCTSDSRR